MVPVFVIPGSHNVRKVFSLETLDVDVDLFVLPVFVVHVLGVLHDLCFQHIEKLGSCARQIDLPTGARILVLLRIMNILDPNAKVICIINFESTILFLLSIT